MYHTEILEQHMQDVLYM